MCLLMHDVEPMKPSNTGWLIADVIDDTSAFPWSRTAVEPELLTLLADPQWQPYIVFPGEFVAPQRVVNEVRVTDGKRPLFILLDGTWSEARKMFRKSPYLEHLPVLSLEPEQLSRYKLRRSKRDDHFCTAEVAALCLNWPRTSRPVKCWMPTWMFSVPTTWRPSSSWRWTRQTACIRVLHLICRHSGPEDLCMMALQRLSRLKCHQA